MNANVDRFGTNNREVVNGVSKFKTNSPESLLLPTGNAGRKINFCGLTLQILAKNGGIGLILTKFIVVIYSLSNCYEFIL